MGKVGRVILDDGDGTFLIQIKGIDGHNGRGELTDWDGWYLELWGLEKI